MTFNLSVTIKRSATDVFGFLRDKHRHVRKGDAVLSLEQTTPGLVGVGTRYRVLVRVLPFVRRALYSRVTDFEPDSRIEEDWVGGGMRGHLMYRCVAVKGGTRLLQTQKVMPQGALVLLSPVIYLSLGFALRRRLRGIKRTLERQEKQPSRAKRDLELLAKELGHTPSVKL